MLETEVAMAWIWERTVVNPLFESDPPLPTFHRDAAPVEAGYPHVVVSNVLTQDVFCQLKNPLWSEVSVEVSVMAQDDRGSPNYRLSVARIADTIRSLIRSDGIGEIVVDTISWLVTCDCLDSRTLAIPERGTLTLASTARYLIRVQRKPA